MLRSILISPDAAIRQAIVRQAATADLSLQRVFDLYLPREELIRVLQVYRPQVILFDAATNPDHLSLIPECARQFPPAVPVALLHHCDPRLLLEAIRAGVRECLFFPFEETALQQAVSRLRDVANEEAQAPTSAGRLYAFMPAKPGCGASTVAVNTALSLTRKKEAKVLLADLDLDHGTCQFLLKQRSGYCVFDALERVSELETFWSGITPPSGGLDVLGSAIARERAAIEPARVRGLIDFVRKLYDVVVMDTAGAIDAVTLEIFKQAERIVLVCQSDLTSAFLAKEKLRLLRSYELEERVIVVLNRWRKGASLRIADFEAMLGLPVELTFPDAPKETHQAVLSGAGISPFTSLGRELSHLAQLFSKMTTGPAEKRRPRKIDYFALVPARFSLLAAEK